MGGPYELGNALIGLVLSIYFLTLLQTVTIVIVPKSATIITHVTLANLQSRVFQPLTVTQSKTVVTTGHRHQNAVAATGILTFYNALQQSQYLAAGTLVTSSNGVNIVTTQDTTITAGDGITNGYAQVPAQATDPGTQGNIPAYAINGTCCIEYILVKNLSAFTEGRDERNYQTVTLADMDIVVSALLPKVT